MPRGSQISTRDRAAMLCWPRGWLYPSEVMFPVPHFPLSLVPSVAVTFLQATDQRLAMPPDMGDVLVRQFVPALLGIGLEMLPIGFHVTPSVKETPLTFWALATVKLDGWIKQTLPKTASRWSRKPNVQKT